MHRKTPEMFPFQVFSVHPTNFSGGDKRDRTADLLNAIDGRSRVHQGQARQKEKPLKYKDFLCIRCFRALYFSASCALDF